MNFLHELLPGTFSVIYSNNFTELSSYSFCQAFYGSFPWDISSRFSRDFLEVSTEISRGRSLRRCLSSVASRVAFGVFLD